MKLSDARKKIDDIDTRLLKLLNERTRWVLDIGQIKKASGQEIYAPERELALLKRLEIRNDGPITHESLKAIYREIMSAALALEKAMTIAVQGPEGGYAHEAARSKFGSSLEYSVFERTSDIFDAVQRGACEYGVVPIETPVDGTVVHTLDRFVSSDLKICAEIVIPVRHLLIGKPPLKSLKKVYGVPDALLLCRQWLLQNVPYARVYEVSGVVPGVELARRERAAVIAGPLAAKVFGLKVLASNLENDDLTSRYYVVGRRYCPPTGNDRTCIMLSAEDKAGSLYRAVSVFYQHKVNMTKIESRPNRGRSAKFLAFIEFDGHCEDQMIVRTLKALGKQCKIVKVLGSYPAVTS